MSRLPSRLRTPAKQQGAVLLFVVMIFLLILPILIGALMKHSMQSTTAATTIANSSAANQAARIELATTASDITQALDNGLLETQSAPPAWFVNKTGNNAPAVRTDAFWSGCVADGQCQALTIDQPNGGNGTTPVNLLRLVVPGGVVSSTACPAEGFVAVYYNIFIQARTTDARDGGSMIQSVYRACRRI